MEGRGRRPLPRLWGDPAAPGMPFPPQVAPRILFKVCRCRVSSLLESRWFTGAT